MSVASPTANPPILYLYCLKPGAGPDYDRAHQAVWPEMLALIEAAGIEDYQIWRHEEIIVCRLRSRPGFDASTAILSASEIQRRWTASLSHLFQSIASPDGEPLWLREVFRFAARADS